MVNDRHGRYVRLRYTATGALAALAATGVLAGTGALAAGPPAKQRGQAAVASGPKVASCPSKTSAPSGQAKRGAPGSSRPFLAAVGRLVDDGTISAAQGQTVDHEIQTGNIETDALASGGFTPAQVQAVQRALANAKRALAASMR